MTDKRLASAQERQRQGGSPSDDKGGVAEGPSWCGIQYLIDSEVMAGWRWVTLSRLRCSWWAILSEERGGLSRERGFICQIKGNTPYQLG